MKTYYVKKWGDSDGKEHTIKAKDKNELKEKMIGKLPYGRYTVKDENGKSLTGITLHAHSRPQLPKEEYDNLYFYIPEKAQSLIDSGKYSPPRLAHGRYDTITEARKSALAKSYKGYKINAITGWDNEPVIFNIYKGTKLLGQVYCSPFAKAPYKGTGKWIEYVHPNGLPFMTANTYTLFKDGSVKKV